jgi:Inosine-uridine preferring nucleoside hydrolase
MPTIPTLIIDSDFFADVDDVGALALAHAYTSRGLCRLAAIALNTPSSHGASAVRAVNDFYGRAVPIGVFRERDDSIAEPGYAHLLSDGRGAGPSDPEAVELLLSVLEGAESASLAVVSIGFLDNLADVALRAPELVADRVRSTVVMAGRFPEGLEFNIERSPEAARTFVDAWPTPITFLGWEVGAGVITGRFPDEDRAPANPVVRAYDAYSGPGTGRMSWDLQAVDLAVRGDAAPYRLSEPGEVSILPDGRNIWRASADGRHRYAIPTLSDAEIAAELDLVLVTSFTAASA